MASGLNPNLASSSAAAIFEPTYTTKLPQANGQRVAIIVNHGMGQQVPYETIEGVAQAVWRGAQNHDSNATGTDPLIRRVRLGVQGGAAETELVRAEISIKTDQQTFDVHIYESYWAPLTEGKVSLKDVMYFLFDAAWNGLMNTDAKKGFQRWMFDAERAFKLPKLRLMGILLSLLVLLLALVFMNSVLAATAASYAVGGSKNFPGPGLAGSFTFDFLVADAGAVLIVLATVLLPGLYKALTKRGSIPQWLSVLGWTLIVPGTIFVFLGGWLMPLQLAGWHPEIWLWPALASWAVWLTETHLLWTSLLWALEFAAAYAARWFLVEYAGDVAAYIAAHTVSKFHDLRQQIWQTAMQVARAVYRAQAPEAPGTFLYDKIIMVGHSLGSVLGYDVLNGLLLEEAFSKTPLQVTQRTRMFLTFGSPLDKTAFLFRTQADMRSAVREVAAAAVQPMIQDYKYRPAEWVNLYSKSDIVSGALDYYDPPGKHTAAGEAIFSDPPSEPEVHKPVQNLRDSDARTPLAAHVEYWTGELFAMELLRAITTSAFVPPEGRRAGAAAGVD